MMLEVCTFLVLQTGAQLTFVVGSNRPKVHRQDQQGGRHGSPPSSEELDVKVVSIAASEENQDSLVGDHVH